MKPLLILRIEEVLSSCIKLCDPLLLVCDKQTTNMVVVQDKVVTVTSWRDIDGCALVHSFTVMGTWNCA
jgi:hypothetical protein